MPCWKCLCLLWNTHYSAMWKRMRTGIVFSLNGFLEKKLNHYCFFGRWRPWVARTSYWFLKRNHRLVPKLFKFLQKGRKIDKVWRQYVTTDIKRLAKGVGQSSQYIICLDVWSTPRITRRSLKRNESQAGYSSLCFKEAVEVCALCLCLCWYGVAVFRCLWCCVCSTSSPILLLLLSAVPL